MSESDGIGEEIEGNTRMVVTVAAQAIEQAARYRDLRMRQAQTETFQEARENQARLNAERNAARVQFSQVHRDDWWNRASDRQVGEVAGLAKAWAEQGDADAVQAQSKIHDEIEIRYGLSPDEFQAKLAAEQEKQRAATVVEEAKQQAEAAESERDLEQAEAWFKENRPGYYEDWKMRHDYADTVKESRQAEQSLIREWRVEVGGQPSAEADQQRAEAKKDRGRAEALEQQAGRQEWLADQAAVDGAATTVEQFDVAAATSQAASDRAWDSSERREAMAADMEHKGLSPELVQTRMNADISQAQPAKAAVTSPKARKSQMRKGARRALTRGRGTQRTL